MYCQNDTFNFYHKHIIERHIFFKINYRYFFYNKCYTIIQDHWLGLTYWNNITLTRVSKINNDSKLFEYVPEVLTHLI